MAMPNQYLMLSALFHPHNGETSRQLSSSLAVALMASVAAQPATPELIAVCYPYCSFA